MKIRLTVLTMLCLALVLQCGCDSKSSRRSSSRSRSRSSQSRSAPQRSSVPLDKQAQRAGENVRRGAEDAYYKHVPKDARNVAEGAARGAGKAADAGGKFVKGLLGK